MNDDTLAAIRAYIAYGSRIAPENVIPANHIGAVPLGLFVGMLPLRDDAMGLPVITQHDRGIQAQAEYQTASYQVQWYRAGGYQAALHFRTYAVSDIGIQGARALGLTFEMYGLAQQDAVIVDAWEERWTANLDIGYVRLSGHNVGQVEHVPLTIDNSPETTISAG